MTAPATSSGPRARLLAMSGSLRAGSSHGAVLEAAALVAPAGVDVTVYDALGSLPPFNPDLDRDDAPAALPAPAAALRALVGRADGLLLSSPEYAHGMPGAFKNMLDWLVGSAEFPYVPVALLGASSRAVHARAQLLEVLRTMNAHVVDDACATLALDGRRMDGAAIAADAEFGPALRAAVLAVVDAVGRTPRRRAGATA